MDIYPLIFSQQKTNFNRMQAGVSSSQAVFNAQM